MVRNQKALEIAAKALAEQHPGREATETDMIRWGERADVVAERFGLSTAEEMDMFDELIASFTK